MLNFLGCLDFFAWLSFFATDESTFFITLFVVAFFKAGFVFGLDWIVIG